MIKNYNNADSKLHGRISSNIIKFNWNFITRDWNIIQLSEPFSYTASLILFLLFEIVLNTIVAMCVAHQRYMYISGKTSQLAMENICEM